MLSFPHCHNTATTIASPSAPNLHEVQPSSAVATSQVEEQISPRSRSRLNIRPFVASFTRRLATATASPSSPKLHHDQPNTNTAKSPDEQLSPPPHSRLDISPSITNLRQTFSRRPDTAASPSTSDFRHHNPAASPSNANLQQAQLRESRFRKFKSGIENLLICEPRRQTGQEPASLEISGPTSFQHLQLDNRLNPIGVIATDYMPGSLSIPSFGTTMAAQDLPQHLVEPDSSSENSEQDSPLQVILTPSQRSARALGLELDAPPPLPQDNRIVREYTDVDPNYFAPQPSSSGTTSTEGKGKDKALPPPSEPVGQWRCCNCNASHPIFNSSQVLGVLHCSCPHIPCEECILSGSIAAFKPPCEPVAVPLDPTVSYGIICPSCGTSWPARTITPKPKFPSLVGRLCRDSNGLGSLRTQMEQEHGEQVEQLLLRFGGLQCTCEKVLDAAALCFRVVKKEQEEAGGASFGAIAGDREQGIGKEVLSVRVKGNVVRHANPLMSNPV
ncbi:hypothetical protein DE146DRAFT_735149 [Phaeosphaeria sp. MPI-PUGE-AT-0046c]|nr:hypothetical protein DE146DRAFT_735149 [Phaeosphaeria sp. MPI-PUGE-AT-0046c]